jgi:hypothetical protein
MLPRGSACQTIMHPGLEGNHGSFRPTRPGTARARRVRVIDRLSFGSYTPAHVELSIPTRRPGADHRAACHGARRAACRGDPGGHDPERRNGNTGIDRPDPGGRRVHRHGRSNAGYRASSISSGRGFTWFPPRTAPSRQRRKRVCGWGRWGCFSWGPSSPAPRFTASRRSEAWRHRTARWPGSRAPLRMRRDAWL